MPHDYLKDSDPDLHEYSCWATQVLRGPALQGKEWLKEPHPKAQYWVFLCLALQKGTDLGAIHVESHSVFVSDGTSQLRWQQGRPESLVGLLDLALPRLLTHCSDLQFCSSDRFLFKWTLCFLTWVPLLDPHLGWLRRLSYVTPTQDPTACLRGWCPNLKHSLQCINTEPLPTQLAAFLLGLFAPGYDIWMLSMNQEASSYQIPNLPAPWSWYFTDCRTTRNKCF